MQKKHDRDDLFDERADIGPHIVQSSVSSIATCVIRFSENDSPERPWAWTVVDRIIKMRELSDFHGTKIPWHPAFNAIDALFHDRKSGTPYSESAASLIQLASHQNEDVQLAAFKALYFDPDPHVKWVAAQFAFELAHYISPIQDEQTFERDDTEDRNAREEALAKALLAPH